MTNPMMSFIVQAFYCFVFDKFVLASDGLLSTKEQK